MLENDKRGDDPCDGEYACVDLVVRVNVRREESECGKSGESRTGDYASDRNIFRCESENEPYGKGEECGYGSEGEKYAECRENAFAAAEARETGEAVPKYSENPAYEREPRIIRSTVCFRGVVQDLGYCRCEESFAEVYEDDWNGGLCTEYAECVRETRIFGSVIPDIVFSTVDDLSDPDCGRNRPQ